MALIDTSKFQRVLHPTEVGDDGQPVWFELRPLRAGDLGTVTSDGTPVQIGLAMLAATLTAWSYSAPVDVDLLDIESLNWLIGEAYRVSGLRSEDEKKASSGDSTLPSPHLAPSPASSGIS